MSIDIDDPFAEIMSEGCGDEPSSSKPQRFINHGGSSGRYIVPFRELDKDKLRELDADGVAAYEARKEIEESVADRAKFRAVVLYLPEDPGRALWPDGKVFQGTHPICQSERTAAPYDNARLNGKIDVTTKQVLKKGGHTGQCSTCGIGTDFCKLRLVAYVIDLGHVKAIDAWKAANPDKAHLVDYSFSKLDAKGPQSYWNFVSNYKNLKRTASAAGKTIGDYVVEFSSEPGQLGSKKVAFKIVEQIKREDPLYSFVRILAREALEASRMIRKSFSALSAPKTTQMSALPPETEEVDGYVVPEEIPF